MVRGRKGPPTRKTNGRRTSAAFLRDADKDFPPPGVLFLGTRSLSPMKSSNIPSRLSFAVFAAQRLVILLAGFALISFVSAGETFSGFIKSVDMSGAYANTFDGLPATGPFPWDQMTSSFNKPFADVKANGGNYVRLGCYYSTTDDTQGLNLTTLQTSAAAAVANGLKIYVDAQPIDGGVANGNQHPPAAWQAAWNAATNNGTSFTWNSTTGAALAADVKGFYQNLVTTLENNPSIGKSSVGIVSIGNEINSWFCGVPSGTQLFYELIYKGAAGVKAADSTVAVMLHLADIDSNTWNWCNKLANCNSISGLGTPTIDFNVFGFSFHAFTDPLYNPNWSGSNCSGTGGLIGLKNAFQTENLAQFKNLTTGNADSGKPIYLMVAETAWIWTGTNEIVNGTSYGERYYETSQFAQDNAGFTFYNIDSSGYLQYLTDECNDVSGLADGYGKGVNAWAGTVIVGWTDQTHQEYNMAFWDSATGALKTTNNGTPILSAYLPAY
jgi:arabinogalactan endo-1,4-beta-galactosidase